MHRHEWHFIVDGPECDSCQYSAEIAIAKCKCGAQIGPSQIERRLNATEALSAEDARHAEAHLASILVFELADTMLDYARTLEGDDE